MAIQNNTILRTLLRRALRENCAGNQSGDRKSDKYLLRVGSNLEVSSHQLTRYGGATFDQGSHGHSLDSSLLNVAQPTARAPPTLATRAPRTLSLESHLVHQAHGS